MRLFVAVDPGQQYREAMTPWLDAHADLKAVRWVRPERLHATVRFLGDQPAAALPDLRTALRGTVRETEAFLVRSGPPRTFSQRGRPRVLFLPLLSDGALEALATRTAAALVLWHPRDADGPRVFRAHLTLGRVRRDPPRDLTTRLQMLPDPTPPAFTVKAIQLLESVPGPVGPRYEVRDSFPLAKAEPRL